FVCFSMFPFSTIDENNILTVCAEDVTPNLDPSKRVCHKTTIVNKARRSEQEIKKMIAEAERLRDKDKEATDRVKALNELQTKLSLLRAQTNDPAISSRLSPSQLRSMCTSLDEVDGWLAMNNESSKEDYEVKMEDLDAACKPLMQVQSYFLLVYLV